MESWKNTVNEYDAYIQFIEYSLLMNIQEMTSLRHGCTRIADWLEPTVNRLIRVTFKQISDTQSHDFYQVNISCINNAFVLIVVIIGLFTRIANSEIPGDINS